MIENTNLFSVAPMIDWVESFLQSNGRDRVQILCTQVLPFFRFRSHEVAAGGPKSFAVVCLPLGYG
jgi:hypothetical protein